MSDAPFGSVENGLEMGKLEDGEEVVTETQVRKKECERRGGVEKRHQLRRLRKHLSFGVWVGRVGRGSGRSGRLPGFHLYFCSEKREEAESGHEATVGKANWVKRCYSFPSFFPCYINSIGRKLAKKCCWAIRGPLRAHCLPLLNEATG